MDVFAAIFYEVFGSGLFIAVLAFCAFNVVLGIASSLYHKEFRMGAIADWLLSRIVPYVLAAAGLQVALHFVPDKYAGGLTREYSEIVWAFVILALIGKIVQQLREIGAPLPAALGDRPKAEVKVAP